MPSTYEGKEYWNSVADRCLQDNQYCQFPSDVDEYDITRYLVFNVQNEHTVEFRMFKSPSNHEKVLWNLQVVTGLLEFSKDSNSLEEWKASSLNPMNW
jgi:hypothetical protein